MFNCLGFCCGKVMQKHTLKNQSINSFLLITRDQWKTTPTKLTGEALKFGVKSMSVGASLGLDWPLGFTTA